MAEPKPLPKGVAKLSWCFCGCASEETTWKVVLEELERCERKEHRHPDTIVMHLCCYFNLTEHGGSIHGSWLTEDGTAALNFLRKHGIDWQEKAEFVDSDGVHHGKID